MKQKRSPHLNPLPKGEEERKTLLALSETILQRLSAIEDLLKRKDNRPLTFKEACTYLGYAPSYLYKLTYKNIVPHYKPTGKIIFFSKNELDEWIFKSSPHLNLLPKGDEAFEKDPGQIEMGFDEIIEGKNEEKIESEIVIEFPLKSRRLKKL